MLFTEQSQIINLNDKAKQSKATKATYLNYHPLGNYPKDDNLNTMNHGESLKFNKPKQC